MAKYYFQKNDESCYTLEYHLNYMRENHIKTMDVFEAKIERDTGYFFCQHFKEVGETGHCGKHCKGYKPRNHKSGICKHYDFPYENTNIKKTLKL